MMSEYALKKYAGARVIDHKVVGCRYGDGIVRLGVCVLCDDCNYVPCRWDKTHNTSWRRCVGCNKKLPTDCFKRPNGRYCVECLDKRKWASSSLGAHRTSGYEVNIDTNDLFNLVKNGCHCALCGIELDFTSGIGHKINSPSVDRIFNGNEMSLSNIAVLCLPCNRAKSNYSRADHVDRCKRTAVREELIATHAFD